ncbi:MAG: recombinase-like helix-turn-helix domain-containing protein [Thiolinea sp.]
MSEYNSTLAPWRGVKPSNKGGAGNIEQVDKIENIVWQNRMAPPTDYENALADALESLFRQNKMELPEIVAGLNATGMHGPDGRYWTEESFQAEMARLGR